MNIQVSNLDATVTAGQLIDLFKQHGEVTGAEVALDVFTGQPRGFAFVEMPDDSAAEAAIGELNHFHLNDRDIQVQAAAPKVEHKGSYPVGNTAHKSMPFQPNGVLLRRKEKSPRGVFKTRTLTCLQLQ